MKTRFVLHGGYTSTENELNAGFYKEMSRYVGDGGNILLVYFSRDDEDYNKVFKQDSEKINQQAEGKKLNIKMATKYRFLEEIDWADVVYMRGGDTQKLIDTLTKYPELENRIKGKVVVGSSAGAYAISTYYYSNSSGKIQKGLGFTPLRVVCHYESDIHENIGEDPVKLMEE